MKFGIRIGSTQFHDFWDQFKYIVKAVVLVVKTLSLCGFEIWLVGRLATFSS